MRSINVWGLVHPEEVQSMGLVNELRAQNRQSPNAHVRPRLAHASGCICCRNEGVNLAFILGRNARTAARNTSEARCVERIESHSRGVYGTIDAHQIMTFGSKTAYIDKQYGVSPLMLGFLRMCGIRSLIATDGWGMQGHVPNACLLDSSYKPGEERTAAAIAIRRLASDPNHPTAQAQDFTWYEYAGELHAAVVAPPRRNPETAFKPLEEVSWELTTAIGMEGLALHLLNWRGNPLPSGIWAEVVTPIDVPDTTAWPDE